MTILTPTRADAFIDSDEDSRAGSAWRYLLPALLSVIAVPILVYATICSLRWFTAPFPGLLVIENGVVPSVSTFAWPPDRAAVFHSRVIAINGEPVTTNTEIYQRVAAQPAGTEFTYTFERGTVRFDKSITSRAFTGSDYLQTYGLILLVGGTYLALGMLVGFLQPVGRQARVFLVQAFVAGLYPITGIFLHSPGMPWLARLNLTLECFFAATWIHLALVFPIERRWRGIQRAVPALPYLISAGLTVAVLTQVFRIPPRLEPLHLTYSYHAFSIVFFLGAIAFAYWENREPAARSRILTLFPGLLLASLLPLVAFVDNALSGREFPVQFALLLIPLLQTSVAYAIIKHDLFDIDRVVRQGFVYALVSFIVASTYAVTLAAAAHWAPGFAGTHQAWLGVIFAFVVAFALDPLRQAVQVVVDRTFYRSRLDYQKTIGELSAVMTTLLDIEEIAGQVTRVPTESMHLECTTLYTVDDGLVSKWHRRSDGQMIHAAAPAAIRRLAEACKDGATVVNAGSLAAHVDDPMTRADLSECLGRDGVQLILPLFFRQEPIGLLGLGVKRSGRPFGDDDIELLHTLANETAIAVHNARSYNALQALAQSLDVKVQAQTEALRASNDALQVAYDDLKAAQSQLVQSEKMASLGQLVAGVAHELNNPASFIHGGLANLSEYLDRIAGVLHAYEQLPIDDAEQREAIARLRAKARIDYILRETPELLRICSEGSERIRRIVEDLRLFARAERGERRAANLADAIDGSLRLLGDRITNERATIIRYRNTETPVPLDASQLSHVWMNLLTNALDAISGSSDPTIRITLRDERGRPTAEAPEQHGVAVEIHDNGSGIEAKHLHHIFEPFFTTKAVGHGTGLGLSIAYGAVKSHGGTITVDSQVGIGTRVTVWLPV